MANAEDLVARALAYTDAQAAPIGRSRIHDPGYLENAGERGWHPAQPEHRARVMLGVFKFFGQDRPRVSAA
jgi:hypothetical protein